MSSSFFSKKNFFKKKKRPDVVANTLPGVGGESRSVPVKKKEKPILSDMFIGRQTVFDSDEELYFSWWVSDLYNAGYIKECYYNSVRFPLSPEVRFEFPVQLKRKIGSKSLQLNDTYSYKPDFIILWNEKAKNIFFDEIFIPKFVKDGLSGTGLVPVSGNSCSFFAVRACWDMVPTWVTFVDVKGKQFRDNSTRELFSIKQSLMMFFYGVCVEKATPHIQGVEDGSCKKDSSHKCVFQQTFVPTRFLFTDKQTARRKILYEVKTLQQFVASFQAQTIPSVI